MSKKITEFAIAILIIGVGVWASITATTLPESSQTFIIVASLAMAALYLIGRQIPFDYKLTCLLILGYAFAGKGFAYISPFEPLYIGEIVWLCCLLGYIMRVYRGAKVMPTFAHFAVFLWVAVVGLYLIQGYPRYGTMAIRDSAIGYYAMFAIFGYTIFSHNEMSRSFRYVLNAAIALAWLGAFTGAAVRGATGGTLEQYFFRPHPDAILPLIAAGGIYYLLIGIREHKPHLLLLAFGIMVMLAGGKTAGFFSLFCVGAYCVILGKRMDLIVSMGVITTLLSLIIAVMIIGGFVESETLLADNEHLNSLGIGPGERSGTTEWRIAWWTTITEDVMAISPTFGMGMGSDITSHFLQDFMRIDPSSKAAASYARYPHCVAFTVLGRMGLLGLGVFLATLIMLFRMCCKVTPSAIKAERDEDKTALLAMLVFMTGVANGFVQATYEIPYGAITHWFCLGCVMAYYRKQHLKKTFSRRHAGKSSHPKPPQLKPELDPPAQQPVARSEQP